MHFLFYKTEEDPEKGIEGLIEQGNATPHDVFYCFRWFGDGDPYEDIPSRSPMPKFSLDGEVTIPEGAQNVPVQDEEEVVSTETKPISPKEPYPLAGYYDGPEEPPSPSPGQVDKE